MELGERFADIDLWNLVFFDQDAFEIAHPFSGVDDGLVKLILSDAAIADQKVKLGRSFLGYLSKVEERNPKRFCNFINRLFIFSSKATPAFLVEKLEHSHQILVVGDDRVCENLFGLESGPFIVRRVMNQRRVSGLELRDIVDVGDVHGAQILGAETGQTLFGNGNTDFFDAVDVRNLRENLFLLRIEREEGQIFRIEQTEDVLVQIEQDLIEIVGGMNLSGNAFDMLRVLDFLLQLLDVWSYGLGLHSTLLSPLSRRETIWLYAGFVGAELRIGLGYRTANRVLV